MLQKIFFVRTVNEEVVDYLKKSCAEIGKKAVLCPDVSRYKCPTIESVKQDARLLMGALDIDNGAIIPKTVGDNIWNARYSIPLWEIFEEFYPTCGCIIVVIPVQLSEILHKGSDHFLSRDIKGEIFPVGSTSPVSVLDFTEGREIIPKQIMFEACC